MPTKKAAIMDCDAMRRALTRISFEIAEKNQGTRNIVLVGIRTRGVYLAERISDKLCEVEGEKPPVIALDTTPWRDDASPQALPKVLTDARVIGANVIIVDDVLYTGRTVRAAIEAVSHMGRPGRIQLAVLIDRGHREVPIRPDYIGKNLPTSHTERVQVHIKELDGKDAVEIFSD